MWLLLSCASPEPGDTDAPAQEGDADADTDTDADADSDTDVPYEIPAVEVVHFDTDDGVTIEADWYANRPGCLGVLLLHMVPPTYDRTTWPVPFIEELRQDGHCVLAIDRRGAGGSGGDAVDAYSGPKGKQDARAAVGFMTEYGIGDLALIAASNGTTTANDYATTTGTDHPAPVSMIWMSPDTYTVSNHGIDELSLDRLMMIYPASERDWPEEQRGSDPGTWAFLEYARGQHGTGLFELEKTSGDLRTWLSGGDPTEE